MPVWTGRGFDKYEESELTPIDMSRATAVDILTGYDASAAIDGNANNHWDAFYDKASIVIDLKDDREICALGHYVRRVTRESSPFDLSKFSTKITAGFPTKLRVSTSTDGVSYTAKAEVTCRIFSGEQMIPFEKTTARYVKFEILSTVGTDTLPKNYGGTKTSIGNISLFQ